MIDRVLCRGSSRCAELMRDSKVADFALVVPVLFGIRLVGPALRPKPGVARRVKIADSSLLRLYSCRQGGGVKSATIRSLVLLPP